MEVTISAFLTILAIAFGMTLPWTELAAVAAVTSAIFLALTWSVARKQLTSLNKATQLQNFVALAQEMDSKDFSSTFGFIWNLRNLPLDTKRICLDQDAATADPQLDRVTNYIERVAFLANHGFLEYELAIQWWGVIADDIYKSIGDFIEEGSQSDPGFCSELKRFVAAVNAHWERFGKSSTSAASFNKKSR